MPIIDALLIKVVDGRWRRACYRFLLLMFICIIFSACSVGSSGGENSNDESEGFDIVILPDTQSYAEKYPEIFYSQTKWIAQNRTNIKFVIHVGDIVENYDAIDEWEVADEALSYIDYQVPYSILPGNHDMIFSGEIYRYSLMSNYFPVERLNVSTYGGTFNNGHNTYHTFDVGSQPWLIISLEFFPHDEVVAWANSIITQYPDHWVIIVTHAYLKGEKLIQMDEPGEISDGVKLWNNLISKYENIKFVICGHGSCNRTSRIGDNGNIVYEMMVNYSGSINGGNGYLRILHFSEKLNVVISEDYSPYIDEFNDEQYEIYSL